ncbi:MAG TPA: sigma-70 family RNA polymerase sigma factor [Thermomicrobiales bacterium]|nr:sigma-70 family RNA polymerase sigma factor [Thermomicrobiales bacterium]
MTDTADQELRWIVAACNNPRDFAPLYQRYATQIYRYCYRHVGNAEVANDLTAQIFVRAIERLHQFRPRPGATFRSWLFAIARNLVADSWRRSRPTRPIDDHESALSDPDPGPEEIAVHRAELDELLAILHELPERQQSIIQLRLAGLTTNEIADVLGVTQGAVKSAQTRAYATIRALMAPPSGASS